jgi:pilus assembly protein CpaF
MSEASSSRKRAVPDAATVKVGRTLVDALAHELEGADVPLEEQPTFAAKRLDDLLGRQGVAEPLRAAVRQYVLEECVGYGPLEPLLEDPDIGDIMVNAPDNVYVEKGGRMQKAAVSFESHAHIRRIIERIVRPLGREISGSSPTVDARLPDGSRLNAVVPPVGIDGPTLTIRKFRKGLLSVEALIEYGSLNAAMGEFLHACVGSRFNIVVSGGTGSGKTTLLNVLSRFIPETERIVTIEDSAELQLQHDNLVRMETKARAVDGEPVTVRDLVRNALRMRPDRIVVGECRGGEALDMLQAMNTGHDGSLTTIHANAPRDAIARLETMVLMGGIDFPLKVVRQHISSAIDIMVQQSRLKDGSRKVTSIAEVTGMEGDIVVMNEVFHWEQGAPGPDGKTTGHHRPTGFRPVFTPRLEAAGFKLPVELFSGGASHGTHGGGTGRRW